MSTKDSTKRRKPRHSTAVYEKIRALDTLKKTEGNARPVELMADVLALWIRELIAADPTSAAAFYRAAVGAWQENRERDGDDGDGGDADETPDERMSRLYHVAFCNRFAEVFNEPRGGPYQSCYIFAAELVQRMSPMLKTMTARAHLASAVQGGTGETPLPAVPVVGDDTSAELSKLRDRLDRIDPDDITNCTARLKVEKMIHDLEREAASDEWPDELPG